MNVKRTRSNGPRHCGFCPNGFHRLCPGDCECGERDHRPTSTVAAAMFRYHSPDRRDTPDNDAAREWRERFQNPEVPA